MKWNSNKRKRKPHRIYHSEQYMEEMQRQLWTLKSENKTDEEKEMLNKAHYISMHP